MTASPNDSIGTIAVYVPSADKTVIYLHAKSKVKAGDKVLRGMPLVDVDWAAVGAAGYQTVTPIVVSNAQGYEGIEEHGAGTIHRGDALFDVVRKADDPGADKTDVQADAAQAKA